MWDHVILDPIQDHALPLCLSFPIFLKRINIDRNNNDLRGIIVDVILVQDYQDLGLLDDKVGYSIQSVLIPQSINCHLCSNEYRTGSLLPLSLLPQQDSDFDFFGAENPLRNKFLLDSLSVLISFTKILPPNNVESPLPDPPLLLLNNPDLDFFGQKFVKVVIASTSVLSPQTLLCNNNNNVPQAPQIKSALLLLP